MFVSEKDEIFGQAKTSTNVKKHVEQRKPANSPFMDDIERLREYIESVVKVLLENHQLVPLDSHDYIQLRDLVCT